MLSVVLVLGKYHNSACCHSNLRQAIDFLIQTNCVRRCIHTLVSFLCERVSAFGWECAFANKCQNEIGPFSHSSRKSLLLSRLEIDTNHKRTRHQIRLLRSKRRWDGENFVSNSVSQFSPHSVQSQKPLYCMHVARPRTSFNLCNFVLCFQLGSDTWSLASYRRCILCALCAVCACVVQLGSGALRASRIVIVRGIELMSATCGLR